MCSGIKEEQTAVNAGNKNNSNTNEDKKISTMPKL